MYKIAYGKFKLFNGEPISCEKYRVVAREKKLSDATFIYDTIVDDCIKEFQLDILTEERNQIPFIGESVAYKDVIDAFSYVFLLFKEADNE